MVLTMKRTGRTKHTRKRRGKSKRSVVEQVAPAEPSVPATSVTPVALTPAEPVEPVAPAADFTHVAIDVERGKWEVPKQVRFAPIIDDGRPITGLASLELWLKKAREKHFKPRPGSGTSWVRESEGMYDMHSDPGPPRRKADIRTSEMLDESARLFAEGRKDYWLPALKRWPDVPREKALQYFRTAKFKHRKLYDSFIEKYTKK